MIASAALFWLDGARVRSRHPLRDAVFAVAMSVAAYLLFARVLQLSLPAGVLAGLAVDPSGHARALRGGFASALSLAHLGWALAGVTLGTAVGVLPGIGPALTVALLLPITFSLDPTSAFIMFGGIYYGAMYGGSTTSILLNTPGETASIATALDGYAMARQGRGAAALTTAAVGSFVAGTLATMALTFFSPPLAAVALRFGPAEYFALAVLAFTSVTALVGGRSRAGCSACSSVWRSASSASIS